MKTTKRKPTKTSNLLDSIIPFSATAKMVVQEYSSGTRVVLLDSDTPKARRILKKFDASFKKKTDEIFGDEFVKRIYEIYGYSNSRGGMACNWITDEKIEYKELN
jgi:hypothetical protein